MRRALSIFFLLSLFSVVNPARALPYRSSFTLKLGAGFLEEEKENGVPDPETGEVPTESYFSGMLAFGYTNYWPCSKKHSKCLVISPQIQTNFVGNKENKHLYSAYIGIGFLDFLASVRFLAGYAYSEKYGGTLVLGIEFGMIDFFYLNALIDTEREGFYVTFGIDIIGLIKIFTMNSGTPKGRKRRPNPEYTSPDGRPPLKKTVYSCNSSIPHLLFKMTM